MPDPSPTPITAATWRIVVHLYPDALDLLDLLAVTVETFTTESATETPYKAHAMVVGEPQRIIRHMPPGDAREVLRGLQILMEHWKPLTLPF